MSYITNLLPSLFPSFPCFTRDCDIYSLALVCSNHMQAIVPSRSLLYFFWPPFSSNTKPIDFAEPLYFVFFLSECSWPSFPWLPPKFFRHQLKSYIFVVAFPATPSNFGFFHLLPVMVFCCISYHNLQVFHFLQLRSKFPMELVSFTTVSSVYHTGWGRKDLRDDCK